MLWGDGIMLFGKSFKLSRLIQIISDANRLGLIDTKNVDRDGYYYEKRFIFDKFYITKQYD